MSSLNKVTLIGNLGNDPEIRTFQTGDKVANLSIATSEKWKAKDGTPKEKTEWHRVSILSQGLVKVVESYLKKGSKVYIEGQLETRKWQDQSGEDKYATEIILRGFNSKLIMLGGNENGQSNQTDNQKNMNAYAPVQQDAMDDEIPF